MTESLEQQQDMNMSRRLDIKNTTDCSSEFNTQSTYAFTTFNFFLRSLLKNVHVSEY